MKKCLFVFLYFSFLSSFASSDVQIYGYEEDNRNYEVSLRIVEVYAAIQDHPAVSNLRTQYVFRLRLEDSQTREELLEDFFYYGSTYKIDRSVPDYYQPLIYVRNSIYGVDYEFDSNDDYNLKMTIIYYNKDTSKKEKRKYIFPYSMNPSRGGSGGGDIGELLYMMPLIFKDAGMKEDR